MNEVLWLQKIQLWRKGLLPLRAYWFRTIIMTRTALQTAVILLAASSAWAATSERLRSPDGRLMLQVEVREAVTFSVKLGSEDAVLPSMIDLQIAGESVFGEQPSVAAVRRTSGDEWVAPVVPTRQARLHDRWEGLTLEFESGAHLEFRAYDAGVAYRFVTNEPGEIDVTSEQIDLRFPSGTKSWFPEEESMISHNERLYPYLDMADIGEDRFCSLPVMLDPPGDVKVLFSEADLYNYPALYMKGGEGAVLSAKHPKYVLQAIPAESSPDRNQEIVREADYIARTDGSRTFPWRVFVTADRDGAFIEQDLVFLLSRPLKLQETSWIQPGVVAWDWYNMNNLVGVDFRAGINTETYRYFIDFAADFGLEYVILDEGWSRSTTEIDKSSLDIDLQGLIEYGEERDVGIILWALWGPISREREELFPLYEQWGVKGVKIDFMQRSDQGMVEFYEETAALAAKHHLLVDYHGSFKPAGLRRAYPNLLTYEAVKGNENNKWSDAVTPRHNVTIPFTRMAVGPMDYTPGAMLNMHPRQHGVSFSRPASIGTRAHEVAKYVVYESPLQMFCDTPSVYRREAETARFMAQIPVIWDETRVLQGKIGEFILIARRKADMWYIAAMTNEEPREVSLDWSFLPEGNYRAAVYRDGINADNHAEDYKLERINIVPGKATPIKMAPGGGWTAIIEAASDGAK